MFTRARFAIPTVRVLILRRRRAAAVRRVGGEPLVAARFRAVDDGGD